jgi:hypothetical protein
LDASDYCRHRHPRCLFGRNQTREAEAKAREAEKRLRAWELALLLTPEIIVLKGEIEACIDSGTIYDPPVQVAASLIDKTDQLYLLGETGGRLLPAIGMVNGVAAQTRRYQAAAISGGVPVLGKAAAGDPQLGHRPPLSDEPRPSNQTNPNVGAAIGVQSLQHHNEPGRHRSATFRRGYFGLCLASCNLLSPVSISVMSQSVNTLPSILCMFRRTLSRCSRIFSSASRSFSRTNPSAINLTEYDIGAPPL